MKFEDALFQVRLRGARLIKLCEVSLDDYGDKYGWSAQIMCYDAYGDYGKTPGEAIMNALKKYDNR